MSLLDKFTTPARGYWKVTLEDGSVHEVTAEFGGFGKLTVTWDSSVVFTGMVIVLLGEIGHFRQGGHLFTINNRGFGRLGHLALLMDGVEIGENLATTPASIAPAPMRPSPTPNGQVQFVKELTCTETEEVIGTEDYPLDNSFGTSPLSTDREVSRQSTNEFSIDSGLTLSGKLGIEAWSVINAEASAEVSRQIGCKIGETVSESQTLHFTVSESRSVLYRVLWKRKVRSGERLYSANGVQVTVPYRVTYGLSCEVQTLHPPAK